MPRQKKLTLYTFAELLEHAKRDGYRTAVTKATQYITKEIGSQDWEQSILEDWKTALRTMGFVCPDISYSLSFSQGDGASFTSVVDLNKLIEFLSTGKIPETKFITKGFLDLLQSKIEVEPLESADLLRELAERECFALKVEKIHSSNYAHAYTCRVDVTFFLEKERADAIINRFVTVVEMLRVEICTAIYEHLRDVSEAQTSDDAIAAYAAEFGLYFRDNGEYEEVNGDDEEA